MKILFLCLLLCATAAGHITEKERPWIFGIQDAAHQQQEQIAAQAESLASAKRSIDRYETLYGELQVAHVELQKKADDVAAWGVDQQTRADNAEKSVDREKVKTMRWLLASCAQSVVILGFIAFKLFV